MLKFVKLIFVSLIVLTISIPHSHAQELYFEKLLTRDGEANLSVRQIIQDKNGFLWLATFSGLYRYEGDEYLIPLAYLNNSPIRRPGRTSIPIDYEFVETDYDHVQIRLGILKQALEIAEKGAEFLAKNEDFYHDFVLLPINLYLDLLTFETSLHEMSRLKKMTEESGNKSHLEEMGNILRKARDELDIIHQRNVEGDKNKKWEGWYDPAKRRPNNGFPTQEKLDAIEVTLNTEF